MDINTYYEEMKYGFRPTQYKVSLLLPDAVAGGSEAAKKIEFTCKQAQLPGFTIGTTEVHYRGKTLPFVGDITFEPFEGSFYIDENFVNYNGLENWGKLCKDFSKTGGAAKMSDVTVNLHIYALDQNDNVLKERVLRNAWISTLAPVDLSFESKDTLAETSFTILYSHFD